MARAATTNGPFALGALLFACGAPLPGPVPESARPPPAQANQCPPVSTFAAAPFFLFDLEERRTCQTYVEQDECIVSLFADCTVEGRQWAGRIRDGELILGAVYLGPSVPQLPRSCRGAIEPEGGRAFLRCSAPDHRGFYLERVQADPPALGQIAAALVLGSEITALAQLGDTLWIRTRAGIERLNLGAEPASVPVAAAPELRHWTKSGPRFVVASESGVAWFDPETGQIGEEQTLPDLLALAPTESATTVLVASVAAEGSRLEFRGGETLAPVGESITIAGRIRDLIQLSDGDYLAGRSTAAGDQLVRLNPRLHLVASGPTLSRPLASLVALPGPGRAAYVLEGESIYYEWRSDAPTTPDLVPVPYAPALRALAGGPSESLVVAEHEDGAALYAVDRALGRAGQGTLLRPKLPSALFYDSGEQTIYLAEGRQLLIIERAR